MKQPYDDSIKTCQYVHKNTNIKKPKQNKTKLNKTNKLKQNRKQKSQRLPHSHQTSETERVSCPVHHGQCLACRPAGRAPGWDGQSTGHAGGTAGHTHGTAGGRRPHTGACGEACCRSRRMSCRSSGTCGLPLLIGRYPVTSHLADGTSVRCPSAERKATALWQNTGQTSIKRVLV